MGPVHALPRPPWGNQPFHRASLQPSAPTTLSQRLWVPVEPGSQPPVVSWSCTFCTPFCCRGGSPRSVQRLPCRVPATKPHGVGVTQPVLHRRPHPLGRRRPS